MTIKTTRWRPDTCGCEIEYTWDDSVPAEQRVHTHKSIVKCPVHANEADDFQAHNKVKEENTTKNKIEGYILENFSELADIEVDETGNTVKKWKSNIKYHWSFDANRDLVYDIVGAPTLTKNKIDQDIKKDLKELRVKRK